MLTTYLNSLTEISIHKYGLTSTGLEDESSPRKQYSYTAHTGIYNLASFFGISPKVLRTDEKTIWLTPACIEDFLIFHAFETDNFCFITVAETEHMRTLYGFDDANLLEELLGAKSELYINPKVLTAQQSSED